CVAVIQLQRKDIRREGQPFKLIGGPIIPIAAIVFAVWLASHAEAQEFAAVGIAFVVACAIYFLMRKGARPAEE
ncbi:MAG: hypothetical protein M3Q09_05910, partial [Gemmatimonadota bacterium]|nr:hypothetical protein [Gemmatimonadota bacterium]